MFFEMFAASALATVLFSGNTNPKDYSVEFYRVNNKLDEIDNKLDKIIDTQAFMRARSCLENFSPLLLDGISLSYKHHTINDIMEAAQEGFNLLCKIAVADENNFKEARKIFADTWGNAEWVNKKFGKEIDEWSEKTANCEREYDSLKPVIDELNKKLTDTFYEITQNTPTKKILFKTIIDKEKTKELIKILYDIYAGYPELISSRLHTYLVERDDESLSLHINSNKLKTEKERYLHAFIIAFTSSKFYMSRGYKSFVNACYKLYFENKTWHEALQISI